LSKQREPQPAAARQRRGHELRWMRS